MMRQFACQHRQLLLRLLWGQCILLAPWGDCAEGGNLPGTLLPYYDDLAVASDAPSEGPPLLRPFTFDEAELYAEAVFVSDQVAFVSDQAEDFLGPYFEPDFPDEIQLAQPARYQPQPALQPQLDATAAPAQTAAAQTASSELFGGFGVSRSLLTSQVPGAEVVSGSESMVRGSTDTADLLGSSPSVLSLGVQRRNPIVTDPRVRGSRVGSLAASGSYWIPARIDLDTPLSKIDSRVIEQAGVVPGPYSSLYGPGLRFVETELKASPRYEGGFKTEGSTVAEFKSNGEQWYGGQNILGGNSVWGFRAGYGHRTGNDYAAGNGALVPTSYKSRDAHLALGAQVFPSATAEIQYLRLDQTDVELPGQAFDIDYLVTDGYELTLTMDDRRWCDQLEVESWYNNTRLAGSAQRPGKRSTFPVYDSISFVGSTNVNTSSAGYRAAATWGDREQGDRSLVAGADLRYVKQELNEITNSLLSGFDDVNSPIPKSHLGNPGLFAEVSVGESDDVQLRLGGRIDWASSNIDVDPATLQPLPEGFTAAELLGSDQFAQDELLGLGYMALERQITDTWNTGISLGYGERAPNLTERYAIYPFMFLLQNGLNTLTGAPDLDKERRFQIDFRIAFEREYVRSRVTLFHAWSFDHITFENFNNPPLGGGNSQVQLKYVNTRLAVLKGFDSRSEIDLTPRITAFANVNYVEGDDRTRNGDFATAPASFGTPSFRDPSLPRGAFGLFTTADVEPLPGILPLESRLGLRIQEPVDSPNWGIEVFARWVNAQTRVATSLLESPTPSFATGDILAFWQPRQRLYLSGGVENFTNTRYREHLDFRSQNGQEQVLQPGVNFYFSGQVTY